MEKSTFTPMVFSTFGGMGNECHRALQRAAGKIASKRKESYADVMGHISTRIRMCILRTVLMSVRGSRGTSKGTSKPISSVIGCYSPSSLTTVINTSHCLNE